MGKLENKILDMKFLVLLAAVVAAQEAETQPQDEPAPVNDEVTSDPGKAAEGEACDATADNMGCADGLQCGTAGPVVKKCVKTAACGVTTDGVEQTCGANALAATVLAAFAIASTF